MAGNDDIQINVNDLMAAFAAENSTLSQRAIIAEQRAKAFQKALATAVEDAARLRSEVEVLRSTWTPPKDEMGEVAAAEAPTGRTRRARPRPTD